MIFSSFLSTMSYEAAATPLTYAVFTSVCITIFNPTKREIQKWKTWTNSDVIKLDGAIVRDKSYAMFYMKTKTPHTIWWFRKVFCERAHVSEAIEDFAQEYIRQMKQL